MIRKLVFGCAIGALLSGAAVADDRSLQRAQALLDTYAAALASCDIETFDAIHADNLQGSGFPGSAGVFNHDELAASCQMGFIMELSFDVLSASEAEGILEAQAEATGSLTGIVGQPEPVNMLMSVRSRLTANGDEQIIYSDFENIYP